MWIGFITTNPCLHMMPMPGLSFYASALIGVLVFIAVVIYVVVEVLFSAMLRGWTVKILI